MLQVRERGLLESEPGAFGDGSTWHSGSLSEVLRRAEDTPTAKHHWWKPHCFHTHQHEPSDASKPAEANQA